MIKMGFKYLIRLKIIKYIHDIFILKILVLNILYTI